MSEDHCIACGQPVTCPVCGKKNSPMEYLASIDVSLATIAGHLGTIARTIYEHELPFKMDEDDLHAIVAAIRGEEE
jgi:hypothetical protein